MSKIRVRLKVTGLVQGVFYRATTKENADRIGVYGWVRNMRDRSVEVEVEGEKEKVNIFIEKCWEGSRYSKVENIEIREMVYKGEFKEFSIKR